MSDPTRERPAIHVCLAGPSEPGLYRWVQIGAEEEGVPTRHVSLVADGVVAAAYAAAQSSRFDIGIAIGEGRVVLHEAHMPPPQPVLSFALGADGPQACRLMGGNAARMVVRLPLRLEADLAEVSEAPTLADAGGYWPSRSAPLPERERRAARLPNDPALHTPPVSAMGEGEPGVWADALDPALVTRIVGIVARILRERGIA